MQVTSRIAGNHTGDHLLQLASRAAGKTAEEAAEPAEQKQGPGGFYDPASRISLSVDAVLVLSGSKASDGGRLPPLTEDERNNIPSPALAARENAAFGKYLAEGDHKTYYRTYIEYYDSLQPQDQQSPRYAGTREIAVAALRSLAYSERIADADVSASDLPEAVGELVRQEAPPAVYRPGQYEFENAARLSGRISRANSMYVANY
ncbi:MAG: hypothetical protein QHC90_06535 [Shinella sp.]|nr:hypothetical protein [Shinella sp.]